MGKIEIPKTNIRYPILEKVTKKSIELAVAILYTTGNGLNTPGNTVIVGHNYMNNTFFSNNKRLEIGDKINITDNSGTTVTYTVYDKFIVNPDELECTSQLTNGNKEITLITCTNDNKQRHIIKARVM